MNTHIHRQVATTSECETDAITRQALGLNLALLAKTCKTIMQPVPRQNHTQAISAVWREVKTGAKCSGPTDEGIPKATPGTVYVTIPGWTDASHAWSPFLHDTTRLGETTRKHACTDVRTHAHVHGGNNTCTRVIVRWASDTHVPCHCCIDIGTGCMCHDGLMHLHQTASSGRSVICDVYSMTLSVLAALVNGNILVAKRNDINQGKEKFMLFSDHNRSLLRRQPGAMTIGHSPERKKKS